MIEKLEDLKFENPFAEINANFMTDDDLLKYWIKPEFMFDQQTVGVDITGGVPVFLMGGRGTGKTMILKYLSYDLQKKEYFKENEQSDQKSMKDFIRDKNFLGVYYRIGGPTLGSFQRRGLDEDAWYTIFGHYFDLNISQLYILMLLDINNHNGLKLSADAEKQICEEITALIYGTCSHQQITQLKEIFLCLQQLQHNVEQFINHAALHGSEDKPPFDIITPSGKLIFGIPSIFQKFLPELKNKNILINIDEYENLLEYQQKIINTLIKHAKPPVTFRIGMRLNGLKTSATLNYEEFLKRDADYRVILFENVLTSKMEGYRTLLREISEKRLRLHSVIGNKIIRIEELLESITPEEEAKRLEAKSIKKTDRPHFNKMKEYLMVHNFSDDQIEDIFKRISYPDNPLIEKLDMLLIIRKVEKKQYNSQFLEEVERSMNYFIENRKEAAEYKKYRTAYEKYKIALLFQLISDYRDKKIYAGFDTYAMLSSGIIRNYLELCWHAFNQAIFNNKGELLAGKISIENQTKAAVEMAERSFEDIEMIQTYGREIKDFIIHIGRFFRALHMDERLKEPEPSYFCTNDSQLDKDTKELLDTAQKWSVLQKKPAMQPESPTRLNDNFPDVFVLNRIFSPKFRISYRIRGRTNISPTELKILLKGSEDEKIVSLKKLSKGAIDLAGRQLNLPEI